MYPILCAGKYGVPLRAGKCVIHHITAACSDVSASSRLTLLDDETIPVMISPKGANPGDRHGNLPDEKLKEHSMIFDMKRVAACAANIDCQLKEPVTVRRGISILNSDNLVPGSIMVYVT